MTTAPETDRLRSATEDDVSEALRGSYVAEIGEVGHDKLLEFYNRMLDRFLGERDD
jgi:hypothetical protein